MKRKGRKEDKKEKLCLNYVSQIFNEESYYQHVCFAIWRVEGYD